MDDKIEMALALERSASDTAKRSSENGNVGLDDVTAIRSPENVNEKNVGLGDRESETAIGGRLKPVGEYSVLSEASLKVKPGMLSLDQQPPFDQHADIMQLRPQLLEGLLDARFGGESTGGDDAG